MIDLARLRRETPGCRERVHLNNAGAGLMPEPVLDAIRGHLELEAQIGGYEAADAREGEIARCYEAVGQLLHAPARNIAFTENATVSYAQALSAIPFERGDLILTTHNDYVSNQLQFLSLHRRLGVEVVRAPDRPEGGVDVAAAVKLMRQRRPRLVCVTHVPTSSGLVQDVAAVGAACSELQILYLVDACQSVGQLPVDTQAIGCDFLSATARKFLRGPRGSGFLYVSDRVLAGGLAPLYLDMRGADWVAGDEYRLVDDARRFENWEFACALVLGTGEAARYALSIGIEGIAERAQALAERLRAGLSAIEGVRVLDRGPRLGAIVTAWVEGWTPTELAAALRERRINTSVQHRIYAVLYFDELGLGGALRMSPHYYNTEEEIDQALAAIAELARGRQRKG